MALPPEAIDEVLPGASACVVADVARVVEQDPPKPKKAPPKPGVYGDIAPPAPRQVVELKVKDVLFGGPAKAGDTVQVEKPEGSYVLSKGNTGPFLLQGRRILGRYGPDTYTIDLIKAAAKRLGKAK